LIASLMKARPPVVRQVLPNGLTVIVAPDHSNPDVSILFGVGAGNLDDPLGKAGLAHLSAHMLHWGSEHFTAREIARALDGVGAHLRVRVDGDETTFALQCLPEAMSTAMAVLSDEITRPVYRAEFLAGQKDAIVTLTHMAQEDPVSVARENLITALYGRSSPYHWTERGTPETRNHIWIKDIEEFHHQHYRPENSTIVIAGDVDPADAAQWVERTFGAWKEPGPLLAPTPSTAVAEMVKAPVRQLVPGTRENAVMMGGPGIERQRPDFYAAELMNLILGGWDFNSRLMRDIRDREGLVYHISSSWSAGRFAGPWVLWFESSPDNTDRAIARAIADIKLFQEKGVTADEMQVFKNWIAGRQALSLQTHGGVARSLLYAEHYHLGLDYPWTYPALVAAVTPDAVQDAARQLIHPDDLVVSIAGPSVGGGP
ncbi:MAG: insulinase family protein, partial [Armatimonadota bacterium]|nr:insulinase family protein [Armatimonadota bacterium]